MKKRIGTLLLLLTVIVGLLYGCSKREEEPTDVPEKPAGITVSFNTTIDGYTIPPVFLDGTPKYMPDTPFYVGRTFLGWYYDAEYIRPFHVADGLTEDTVLYAKWRINRDTSELTKGEGQEKDLGGIVYKKSGEEYYVCGYDGILPDVNVPERFNDLPVVGVLSGAFNGTIVRKITISASIKEIEGGAFAGADKLGAVDVAEVSPYYLSKEGVLFTKDEKSLVCLPATKSSTRYEVPASTETIEPYALHDASCSVAFTDDCKITQIGEYAFSGFSGAVTLPGSVSFIQKHAFSGADCRLDFAGNFGMTSFGNGEFDGYIGSSIVVPASIVSLSGAPFSDCLASVDLSETGLTELGENAFYGYLGAELVIPASVLSLKSGCFYTCTSKITFDERSSIRTVGENAFSNFAGKVTFPSTVRKLEKNAFYHARAGAQIVFSTKQSDIVIDKDAFKLSSATVKYQ